MRPEHPNTGIHIARANDLTAALVHAGVGLFGLRAGLSDPLFGELADRFDPTPLIGDGPRAWEESCAALARLAPGLPGPLGDLLRDYRLQLHEWFILGLLGETENSHPLNLAVAALQAPSDQARPSLHLCGALVAALFDTALDPVTLAHHPLVANGLLQVEGTGPLPLRTLALDPRLWALLRGDPKPWPGCEHIAVDHPELVPTATRARLPELAGLLAAQSARVLALRGPAATARAAAALVAEALGLKALAIPEALWRERPILAAACRYAGWLPVLSPEVGPGERFVPTLHPADPGPIVLALGPEGAVDGAAVVELDIPPLAYAERLELWRAALGGEPPAGLAQAAMLAGPAIRALAERARLEARRRSEPLGETHLAQARAQLGAERLRLLAQPVARRVGPEALVLAPALQRGFDDLVRRCLRRESLWAGLGVTLAAAPTPGVRALFVGESGTGKTLAAGRLATCLDAPLYRVDLSAVMNKYVGESEKNLGLLLEAAAEGDVILLLDEADALFGRRTDGAETGERYANMLTNFLLARIETHPGILILTSNSRSRIDPAFTRRLDAILEFPLPGVEERLRLWRSHLGGRAPGDDACRLLASVCDLPGGFIRNAVLNAAARDDTPAPGPIALGLLAEALREEYRKLGRGIPHQLDHLGK